MFLPRCGVSALMRTILHLTISLILSNVRGSFLLFFFHLGFVFRTRSIKNRAHTHYCTSRRLATLPALFHSVEITIFRKNITTNQQKTITNVHLARMDQNVHGKCSKELVFRRFAGDSIKTRVFTTRLLFQLIFLFSRSYLHLLRRSGRSAARTGGRQKYFTRSIILPPLSPPDQQLGGNRSSIQLVGILQFSCE